MVNGGYPEIVSMYCDFCEEVYSEEYKTSEFKCPSCNNVLLLHVMALGGLKVGHMAFAVPSNEIMDYIGKTVLFNGTLDHQIIAAETFEKNNKVRIAVKNHGAINASEDSLWIVINGGWYNNWSENL